MVDLKKAHHQLFHRTYDECFGSLEELHEHCRDQREASNEFWHSPELLMPQVKDNRVQLHAGSDGAFTLNHWSFSQFCTLCGVNRDTINSLSAETASRALQETKPRGSKPMQVLVANDCVRALHGTQYSRLWNADLLDAICEAAPDFQPPQKAVTGGTGLYCGEQDMFAFMIDPAGWTEIEGEHFAPGYFVWNSEVGKRSLGVQTFWFQQVCGNHIVWDAVEVVEYKRKHTGNITESLVEIRQIVESLARKRDERKDGFAKVIANAMQEKVGDAEDATKFLAKQGITRSLIKRAVEKIGAKGQLFTLWTLVDALTQLTQDIRHAGDRTEADSKVAKLLSLAV